MREVVGGGHDAGAGVADSALLPDVKHLLNGFLEAHEVVVYQPCRHKAPLGNHTHQAASHCGNPPLLRPLFSLRNLSSFRPDITVLVDWA